MINRLVYEVRLRKCAPPKAAKGKPWRWDVTYMRTTDPTYPGVETGRESLGSVWGYERWKWQAVKRITDHMLDNDYKEEFEEV